MSAIDKESDIEQQIIEASRILGQAQRSLHSLVNAAYDEGRAAGVNELAGALLGCIAALKQAGRQLQKDEHWFSAVAQGEYALAKAQGEKV